jgi:hypothetical protein
VENVTGLKCSTEDMDLQFTASGRGALVSQRSRIVKCGGAVPSENAGMSNFKKGENPFGRKSEVS